MLSYLLLTRFHFSTQAPFQLGRWQQSHRFSGQSNGVRPQFIGHRGSGIASTGDDLIIGNTATAIKEGVRAGVDWIEIDIRASSDGHLVVFHDEMLDEKTNGKGKVSDFSLAELEALSVNVDPPEAILSLDDLFTKFDSDEQKWIFDIKMKGIHREVLKWIDDKVANGELAASQLIIFGTYDVLIDYKEADYSKGYTVIWGDLANRLRVLFLPSQIIKRGKTLDCDYLVLPVIFASKQFVNDAKPNFEVWIYGTDNEGDLKILVDFGVSGFIVDRPHITISQFGVPFSE